MAKEKLFRDIS